MAILLTFPVLKKVNSRCLLYGFDGSEAVSLGPKSIIFKNMTFAQEKENKTEVSLHNIWHHFSESICYKTPALLTETVR